MKRMVRITCRALGTLILIQGVGSPARSQSISPATEGTGTVVTQTDNRLNIGGGTQAGSNQIGAIAIPTLSTEQYPDSSPVQVVVTGSDIDARVCVVEETALAVLER